MGAAVDGQQQRHGVLGDGVRGVGRHTENPQLSITGFDIHVVESGAPQDDGLNAHFVELLDNNRVYRVVDKDTDCVKSVCEGNGVPVQVRLIVFDFNSGGNGIAVKAGNVIGLRIKECKLHNLFLL